jgi:integrase
MAQVVSAEKFSPLKNSDWLSKEVLEIISSSIEDPEFRRCILPPGFRFLVTDNMELIEPVLFYLQNKCLLNGSIQSVGNTQKAYCDDLYEWWMWLDQFKKEWTDVDVEDLVQYRDTLLVEFSPHTHRRYKSKTIRRRLSTILCFYRWAFNTGLVDENLDRREIRQIPRSMDTTMLSHVDTRRGEVSVSEIMPSIRDEEPINALDTINLRRVLNLLGPMPPIEKGGDPPPRPARDRLIAMLQVMTGMRIDEVLSLTDYQILNLRPRSDKSNFVKLRITKTKGLRPRDVLVPLELLEALYWYIDHERENAVTARIQKNGQSGRTSALFVNGVYANRRDVGNYLRPKTFLGIFTRAVTQAGLVHQEMHRDPVTGSDSLDIVPNYTSHDLRHTFAVMTYFARKKMGDSEPWKTIQILLGHRHLSTTINIYLRSVKVDEPLVTDALARFFKELHNG